MPSRMGLLGKKIGMTQTFDKEGNWLALTVVELGPNVVLEKKTKAKHGYSALKLGFGEQKPSRVSRPKAGVFAGAKTTPKRFVREVRLNESELEQFEVGQSVAANEVFREHLLVDVTATSRGKGFQGVMKRYNFGGVRATHGSHEYFRHGGSIGCRLTPGRVRRGQKMPGQMGNKPVTTQNVRIFEVIPEKNLVLLRGSVPGAPGTHVVLRHAAKRPSLPFELIKAEPAAEEAAAPEA